MEKKKISMSIALVVILAVFGSTLAYLSSNDSTEGEIKVTNADVSIDGDSEKVNLKSGYNIYEKTVPVKNEGENPCFVRVFMDFSDSSVIGSTDSDVRTYFSGSESKPENLSADDTPDSDVWKPASGKEWLSENWIYIDFDGNVIDKNGNVKDESDNNLNVGSGLGGYYYYKLPLNPDESTDPLINWVMTYFSGAEKIKAYDILVYTETVQTIGTDGTDYAADDNINWADAWKEYLHTD